jgi:hypothetical protein
MIRVIAKLIAVLVLLVCKRVLLSILDAVLEVLSS